MKGTSTAHKFLGLLSLILIIQSCCEDKNPYVSDCQKEPFKYLGNFPLTEEKDYLYFEPGSMWIYECDSTLELDTQIMTTCRIEKFAKPYISYELLSFERTSTSHDVTYKTFFATTNIPYDEDFPNERQYNLRINSSQSTGRDAIFFYPFNENNISNGSSPTFYRGFLDSIEILGKWYNHIRIFEVKLGSAWPRLKEIETWEGARYTVYWSKNIGIVKMNVVTAKKGQQKDFIFNWNLKEYNISQ